MKMSEMKKADPKKYEELMAKWKGQRHDRNKALATLIAFCKDKGTPEIQALAAKLSGNGPRTPGAPKIKALDILNAMFRGNIGASITEDKVWAEHKLGRAEMRALIKTAIAKPAPADRLWIVFDAKTLTYTLKAKGENAPAGWDGYMPVKVEAKPATPATK